MNRNDAARIIEVIDSRIRRWTRSLAMVDTTWGEVAAVDAGESTVDVYLFGSPYASEGFRIIGGGLPEVGDSVKVAIDKRTRDRWVMEPIFAAAPGSGVTSHDDLTGVSPNDHHAQVHSIDGGDHTGSLAATAVGFTPFDTIAATNVQAAIEEVFNEGGGGGGVTDHGALTGLADDDHPQYALDSDVTAHTGDTSDAHDASAISILDTGNRYEGTDVESALQELGLRGLAAGTVGCSIVGLNNQTLSNDVPAAINFDGTDIFDTDGFHNPSVNPSRVTIPAGLGGKYLVTAVVGFNTNSTNLRYARVYKNGVAIGNIKWSAATVSYHGSGSVEMVLDLAGGDYIEIWGFQNSGGNLSTIGTECTAQVIKLDSGRVGTGVGARAYHSTTQSIPNGIETAALLDTEEYDTDGFHSTASNTSRMTVPVGLGGKYLVVGAASFVPSNTTGRRKVALRKNGSAIRGAASEAPPSATAYSSATPSAVLDLIAGDYVEVYVYQESGGNLDIGNAGVGGTTALQIMRLDAVPDAVGGVGAKAYSSVVQSISSASDTALTLNSEDFDTNEFHSTSSNTTRMTIPSGLDGKYLIIGSTNFAAGAIGSIGRALRIRKNGTTFQGGDQRLVPTNSTTVIALNTSVIMDLVAGDYVELMAYQDSGSAMNIGQTGGDRSTTTTLQIMRIPTTVSGGGGIIVVEGGIQHNVAATAAPTTGDDSGDGYSVGSHWIDVTNDIGYLCVDNTLGAAVWRQVTIGALVAYTPTLTAATTNPTLGAGGAATGHYRLISDKLVWFNAVVRFGTGLTAGSGQYYVALPFTSFATTSQVTAGQVHDAGTTRYAMSGNIYPSTARVEGWGDWTSRQLQATGGPITWAVNDEIMFTGIYERA